LVQNHLFCLSCALPWLLDRRFLWEKEIKSWQYQPVSDILWYFHM
jgi:hypothetical protein